MTISQKYSEIMQVACDEMCKHATGMKQEKLDEKCNTCSLSRKVNEIINKR